MDVDLARTSYYRPLQRRFADVKPKALKKLISTILAELRSLIGAKQFSLTELHNMWIIKPGGLSRGRGIEVHTDLNDMILRTQNNIGINCWIV